MFHQIYRWFFSVRKECVVCKEPVMMYYKSSDDRNVPVACEECLMPYAMSKVSTLEKKTM